MTAEPVTGPLTEAAGTSSDCVPPWLEARANEAGLAAYAARLASLGAGAMILYRHEESGVTQVITEVRAGGDVRLLKPLYDAEALADRVARESGGSGSFVFDAIDLDVESPPPHSGFTTLA